MYTKDQMIKFADYALSEMPHANTEEVFVMWENSTSERPAQALKTKPFNLEEWIKGGSKVEDIIYRNADAPKRIIYIAEANEDTPKMLTISPDGNMQIHTRSGYLRDGLMCENPFDILLVDRSEPVYVWRNVFLIPDTHAIDHAKEDMCIYSQKIVGGNANAAICRLKLEVTAPGQYVFVEAIRY